MTTITAPAVVASERQAAFIADMLQEIHPTIEAARAEWTEAARAGMLSSQGLVRVWIEGLIARRAEVRKAKRTASPAAGPSIADGYYAVEYAGELRFYALRTAEDGRQWLNRYKSDEELRVTRKEIQGARAEIAKDPAAAAKAFADHWTRCARCARALTDAESRAAGYGPECRAKLGI